MRRLLVSAGLAAFLLCGDAIACGDKFVVFGRGVRFRSAYAATHPAAVLIYMNPASKMPQIEREFRIEAMLKQVGHKPREVSTPEELQTALAGGTYDVVLTDMADVTAVEQVRARTNAKSSIVPTLYNPTADSVSTAQKQYGCLVKAAKRSHDLLLVLDEVMRSRAKGMGDRCQKI
ncbi:MAG TPA: hypothetical protein VF980_13765 [Thermoanaerobaculia bacterium]